LKLETSHLKLNSAISRFYDLNTGIIGVGGCLPADWPLLSPAFFLFTYATETPALGVILDTVA
jgi:hypothetical protein